MNLTEAEIEEIAVRTAAKLFQMQSAATPVEREVLTPAEALVYIGKAGLKDPKKAFFRWRKAHGLRPCAPGRYSLRALKAAMEREQRKTYHHAA
tara:strand:+ start:569 stop:850 length:282 start_codon:yes stop_codon:yes gene_type:complete